MERWNTLHPDATARRSYLEQALAERAGPVIAATDYVRARTFSSIFGRLSRFIWPKMQV